MEAAIVGIVKLASAGLTEGKARQGGVGPRKGLSSGNAVAGTAGAAADEGITMAAIGRIGQLGAAGGAGGQVRGQGRGHQADAQRLGGGSHQAHPRDHGRAGGEIWQPDRPQRLQMGRARQRQRQQVHKPLQRQTATVELHHHRTLHVGHLPREGQPPSQPMHVGPKAHALHHTTALEPQPRPPAHAATGRARASSNASRPSPVRAEACTMRARGATRSRLRFRRARSTPKTSATSTLLITTTSAP